MYTCMVSDILHHVHWHPLCLAPVFGSISTNCTLFAMLRPVHHTLVGPDWYTRATTRDRTTVKFNLKCPPCVTTAKPRVRQLSNLAPRLMLFGARFLHSQGPASIALVRVHDPDVSNLQIWKQCERNNNILKYTNSHINYVTIRISTMSQVWWWVLLTWKWFRYRDICGSHGHACSPQISRQLTASCCLVPWGLTGVMT